MKIHNLLQTIQLVSLQHKAKGDWKTGTLIPQFMINLFNSVALIHMDNYITKINVAPRVDIPICSM